MSSQGFSQKPNIMNSFLLVHMLRVSVRFLGESSARKKRFEIIWPLVKKKMVKTYGKPIIRFLFVCWSELSKFRYGVNNIDSFITTVLMVWELNIMIFLEVTPNSRFFMFCCDRVYNDRYVSKLALKGWSFQALLTFHNGVNSLLKSLVTLTFLKIIMFRSISIKILKQNGSTDSGLWNLLSKRQIMWEIVSNFVAFLETWTSPRVPKSHLKCAKVHKIWGGQ